MAEKEDSGLLDRTESDGEANDPEGGSLRTPRTGLRFKCVRMLLPTILQVTR